MASSDSDDESVVPDHVDNYYLVDERDEPIPFTAAPILWSKDEIPDGGKDKIYLHGVVDNGLQKLYKQVIAWNFDISSMKPEISVLAKENIWIKLRKPRKSYEDMIRTILITVHCLHLLKKNPQMSEKSLWDHLSRAFSLYDVKPSENDLVANLWLFGEVVKRDGNLAKSKFILTLLEDRPRRQKQSNEDLQAITKPGFIVDDDAAIDEAEDDESEEDDGPDEDDGVCAFCDNGGGMLCCDGECLRMFHTNSEEGEESKCAGLGFTAEEAEAIPLFLCKNCEHKQHQCFVCGKLGSSDKSSNAEVFCCVAAGCGHFYHPQCVAEWLHKVDSVVDSEDLQKKIAEGEAFTCPIHKCYVCHEVEDKEVLELQFAVCRRCPKSYHRKCLPREIAWEDDEDEGIFQRAWEGLLPKRILIYCLDHEIDKHLQTPIRDHITFPGDEKRNFTIEIKKKQRPSELIRSNENAASKKRIISRNVSRERLLEPASKRAKTSSAVREAGNVRKHQKVALGQTLLKKVKVCEAPKRLLKEKTIRNQVVTENKGLYEKMKKVSEVEKPKKLETDASEVDKYVKSASNKPSSTESTLDADSERRVSDIMKEAVSSVTLKDIVKRYKGPSTHMHSSKIAVDKITQGKIKGAVEAIRTAVKKLDEGGSIEDARAVCGPEVVTQVFRWKNKLKVYLAPFLYGMRYTSFGRHFTNPDKLQKIVDKLHWYVQNGDTIVDFCCGANDFSCIMKNKLDETGKKCSYKNYDFFQAKNDFRFEKRDWMTVGVHELPEGSRLIMGLNPPFGVKAALANKFINKALEFKPKLIILIVPPETERLDCKRTPYDLVWEDENILSGKSFYLPGSVDINDRQIDQWNNVAPPLYLWSRRDWTAKHKAVAQEQGHLSMQQNQSCISDNSIDHHFPGEHVPVLMDGLPEQKDELLHGFGTFENQEHLEESCQNNDGSDHGRIPSNESSRSRRHHQLPADESDMGVSVGYKDKPNYSPPEATDRQNLYVNQPRSVGMQGCEASYNHDESSIVDSRRQLGAAYDGRITDSIVESYRSSSSHYDAIRLEEKYLGPNSGYEQPYVHQYGLHEQDPQSRPSHMFSHDTQGYGRMGTPEPAYGRIGFGVEPSYRMHQLVTQRYAPQQDELMHTRLQSLGSEPPFLGPGIPPYIPRNPRPGYPPGPTEFAPGTHHVYSRYNSSGWLED